MSSPSRSSSCCIGAPLAMLWLTWAMGPEPARPRSRLPSAPSATPRPAAVANALLTVSEAVSSLTRLDEILETVVQVAPRSIEMDYCGIALWAQDSGKYVRAVASGAQGDGEPTATGLQLSPEQVPDFEWVRRLGHCVVVPVAESLQVAPDRRAGGADRAALQRRALLRRDGVRAPQRRAARSPSAT